MRSIPPFPRIRLPQCHLMYPHRSQQLGLPFNHRIPLPQLRRICHLQFLRLDPRWNLLIRRAKPHPTYLHLFHLISHRQNYRMLLPRLHRICHQQSLRLDPLLHQLKPHPTYLHWFHLISHHQNLQGLRPIYLPWHLPLVLPIYRRLYLPLLHQLRRHIIPLLCLLGFLPICHPLPHRRPLKNPPIYRLRFLQNIFRWYPSMPFQIRLLQGLRVRLRT